MDEVNHPQFVCLPAFVIIPKSSLPSLFQGQPCIPIQSVPLTSATDYCSDAPDSSQRPVKPKHERSGNRKGMATEKQKDYIRALLAQSTVKENDLCKEIGKEIESFTNGDANTAIEILKQDKSLLF